MKELFASKTNDNFSSINDNGVYMSKGKVVNGESVGVVRVFETFSAEPTGRYGVTGTNPFLRKGEKPSVYSSKKVASASTSGASVSKNVTSLDWVGVKTKGLPAYRHIELEHAVKNGVFYGDPKAKIDLAWQRAQELGIKPIQKVQHGGTFDYYIVPLENAGYEYSGGLAKSFTGKEINPVFPNTNCDYVTIVTKSGTNKLKTAYPSSRTANLKVKE